MTFDPQTLEGLSSVNQEVFFNEDVTFYGRVNLDKVVISGSSISFSKNIEFTGGEITVKKLNSTDIITQNINAGISTFQDIYINGKLYDGDGDFGTAGQVLSSDGTNLNWINTSSANVGSATNVGTNLNSDNSDQYVTFVGASSGNNPTRVDEGIKYNPATNRLNVGIVSATTYIGLPDVFPSGGIIMWSGTIANIPNGWLLCDGSNGTPDLRNRFIVGASDDNGTGVTFNANNGATSGEYAPGNSGGSVAHQLTVAEMPSHSHPLSGGDYYWIGDASASADFSFSGSSYEMTTSSAAATQGGNNYHENRPPYYALAFIMKS